MYCFRSWQQLWRVVKMRWVLISVVIASTNGFKIETTQPVNNNKHAISSGYYNPVPSKKTAETGFSFLNQPIAGYPKVPPPNAHESGGLEDDLLPPFEDKGLFGVRSQLFRRSIEDVKVDPKTGYPLVAQPSWKDAGGNEESLELPLEDTNKNEEAVDPKTGYPLVAQPGWELAGGDGDIIQLPLQDSETPEQAVDPKTGYPLVAQPSWKDAGGNEETLQLPLEDPEETPKVDPKTGYPLVADPNWQHAGGNGDILDLPIEEPKDQNQVPVDPKTGYPLIAEPSWQDAGGNGDILDLPVEEPKDQSQVPVDPKTGYPLIAEPSWKDAGGNGEILDLPLEDEKAEEEKVDPKTGYPLVAQPSWQFAGGDEQILELPLEDGVSHIQARSGGDFEEAQLTELRPPDVQSSYATDFGSPNVEPRNLNVFQRRDTGNVQGNSGASAQKNRPVESSYTYTGPENVVVTVTRFLSTDNPQPNTFQNTFPALPNQTPRPHNSFSRREAPAPFAYQRNYYYY